MLKVALQVSIWGLAAYKPVAYKKIKCIRFGHIRFVILFKILQQQLKTWKQITASLLNQHVFLLMQETRRSMKNFWHFEIKVMRS